MNGSGSTARISPPPRSRRSSARHPGVRSVAVYAVPDDPVGDRVMVAIELRAGDQLRPGRLRRLPRRAARSRDEVAPHFVRFVGELPKLASMKIDKQRLRREAWRPADVWWRPIRKSVARAYGGVRQGAPQRPSSVRRLPVGRRRARSSDEAVDGCDPSMGAEAAAAWVADMEAAGIDTLWIGEAYGFDAVSMLGYLAARANRIQLRSGHPPGILPLSRPGGHDRRRSGLRVLRAIPARSRCVRAAGRHRAGTACPMTAR